MAAKTQLLFTFRMVPVIAAMLARHGIDAAAVVKEAGLPPEALRGEITAPLPRVQAFVDGAAKALGTTAFGLLLAEAVPAGSYGIPEFAMRAAPTFEASLRALAELAALINPLLNFRIVIGPDREGACHYAIASQRDTLGLHLNEFTLWYIVRQFAAQNGGAFPLTRVWFSHARTTNVEEVATRFGCPVRFQAPDCGFALSRALLDLTPRYSDPLLFNYLLQQGRSQLANAGQLDIVSHLVRTLEPRLGAGDLGATAIAKAMGVTARSLQRHLADAGTTYRDVLHHVRRRRRAELAGGGLDEQEIARHLGFSDARAMRRSLDEAESV